ncbi:putative phospholipase PldA, partial [Eremomyces bilateralis CBS 781.70]
MASQMKEEVDSKLPEHLRQSEKEKEGKDQPKHFQRGVKDSIRHPFPHIREKLKNTHLHDAKIKAVHTRNHLGKYANLFNRNHRHDEDHEQRTDEKRNHISETHRFSSFAPEREGNEAKFYVDGRDYYWAVSTALERATECIYIVDWWISPELFLRRPPAENQEWRLDEILKRRAEAGVKIYIMVYKEVEQALSCQSTHTKHALEALCPEGSPGFGNIRVMRHPDHNVMGNAADMTFYWAHHEKFMVIDHYLAFIAGLDLCFGRWDLNQHPLADLHPAGAKYEIWPGQDFNNNRILDFHDVQDWEQNQVSKAEYGRMPWHDVGMGLIGPCVYDVAEHFVLRWNFVKRDKYKRDDKYAWLELEGRTGEHEDLIAVQRPKYPMGGYTLHPPTEGGLDGKLSDWEGRDGSTVKAQIVRSSADWSSGILTEHSIQNAYCELIRNAQHFVYIENQFFITATGEGQDLIMNQIGRAIVDACVRAGKEGRKFRVIVIIPAVPGFAGDLRSDAAKGTRAIMEYQYKSICRGENSICEQIRKEGIDPGNHIFIFNLRSYDRVNTTPAVRKQEEKSGVKYQEVQRAEAEELMAPGGHGLSDENNGAVGGDFSEKKEAIEERKQKFEELRVEVGLGNGEDKDPKEAAPSVDTIAEDAMLSGRHVSDEPWTGGDEEGEKMNFIQEQLYIHGKVCIVDDQIALIGSSNINDRSMQGDRDSELTIVIEDTKPLESTMDGAPYTASHFAATLRRTLWREHLGLLPPQPLDASDDPNAEPPGDSENRILDDEHWQLVSDPLGDKVWETWCQHATTNTEVFREIFHADPDNCIRNFEDYEKFLPDPKDKSHDHKFGHLIDRSVPVAEIKKQLDRIKGHLVWMPLDYLCEVEMAERGLHVNDFTETIY